MITKLAVLESGDDTFEVVEPVTGTVIIREVTIYAFAFAFAIGFLDCMDAHLHNTREVLAKREMCLPKLLGHRAADEACKAYFDSGGVFSTQRVRQLSGQKNFNN